MGLRLPFRRKAVAAVEKELGPGWISRRGRTGALVTSDFLHYTERCFLTLCGSRNGVAP